MGGGHQFVKFDGFLKLNIDSLSTQTPFKFLNIKKPNIFYQRTCLWYRFCNKHLPSSDHPIFYCLVSHSTSIHIQRLMLQSVAYRLGKLVKSFIKNLKRKKQKQNKTKRIASQSAPFQ